MEDKYFLQRDWTVESALKLLANFDFSRRGFFSDEPDRQSDDVPEIRLKGKSVGGRDNEGID